MISTPKNDLEKIVKKNPETAAKKIFSQFDKRFFSEEKNIKRKNKIKIIFGVMPQILNCGKKLAWNRAKT
jgi:hypothetical protein